MQRPAILYARRIAPRRPIGTARVRAAFTLVEILVAMAVTLVLLGIVVTVFGLIGDNVSASRAGMEMSDQLRAAKHRLQLDLAGVTTQMLPPRRPEYGEGYFEIIEGPVGRLPANTKWVPDETGTLGPDTTVGDTDDILMLTTRSKGDPFTGRYYDSTNGIYSIQSQVAEVAWFLRGTTLYRRQLLVRPEVPITQPGSLPGPFYSVYDLSIRMIGGNYDLSPTGAGSSHPAQQIVGNSLEDLTRRENRFMHAPLLAGTSPFGWPHDVRGFGTFYSARPYGLSSGGIATVGRLGLPTLRECSHPNFPTPGTISLGQTLTLLDQSGATKGDTSSNLPPEANGPNELEFDAWTNPNPWNIVDRATGTLSNLYVDAANAARVADDIILTNVLSFDVRVWDPTARILCDSSGGVYAPEDPGYAAAFVELSKGTNGYSIVSQGAYVDLYYTAGITRYATQIGLSGPPLTNLNNMISALWVSSPFSGPGNLKSGLGSYDSSNSPSIYVPSLYDTGSWHYEHDGIDQDGGGADQGTDGLDNNGNGLVDEDAELEAPPPYSVPLRGVQIKIRCFEPDGHQIREVTVVQEFVPE